MSEQPKKKGVTSRRVMPFAPVALALLTQVTAGGPPGADSGAAVAISMNWAKPDPQPTTFPGASGTCGPFGTDAGNETNLRKNRTDVADAPHPVTFDAISTLSFPKGQPRTRAHWSPAALAAIKPFEGVEVTVTGFIVHKIKVEGSESTNCGFLQATEVDWHIPLVKSANDPESGAVVVEATPRVRQKHPNWTPEALKDWVNSTSPVRITGWLMLDPEHEAMIGQFRSTLWEVHPITRIEVFKQGQWLDLDDL